jgi:hypothetical protein
MAKTEVFRFRCDASLKERFEIIAKLDRRDPSELARIVFEDFIAACAEGKITEHNIEFRTKVAEVLQKFDAAQHHP